MRSLLGSRAMALAPWPAKVTELGVAVDGVAATPSSMTRFPLTSRHSRNSLSSATPRPNHTLFMLRSVTDPSVLGAHPIGRIPHPNESPGWFAVPGATGSVALAGMSSLDHGQGFSAGALRGASGVVDHRLARRHLINEFRRGRLRQDQVCDAHPEL